MKTYVTFGQDHVHVIENAETGERLVFYKDCVASIEANSRIEGRNKAFDLFGPQFCMEYFEEEFKKDSLCFFKRGVLAVPTSFNILT